MPPMVIASASTGALSYYLDHPDGSARWETFIGENFPEYLRDKYNAGRDRASTFLAGISMGGYGALKIAFARPDQFAAVAAIQPLLEPGFRDSEIGARNRLHHMVGGPRELLGESRDAALFEANNPAEPRSRQRACDSRLRARDLSGSRRRGFPQRARRHRIPASRAVGPRYLARVPPDSRRRSRRPDVRAANPRRLRMARLDRGRAACRVRGTVWPTSARWTIG